MSKHTAGPWRYLQGGVAGEFVVIRDTHPDLSIMITSFIDTEADARLIAAAPDLLEALREVLEHVETPPDRNCSCHILPPCGDCLDHSGLRAAIEMSEAVIAKARGEV